MSLVHINWKPDARELRKFGVAMLVGFGLIGLLLWVRHRAPAAEVCWVFGAAAGLLGLTGTRAALPVYWAWMGVAFVMGNIMNRVILVVFYYGMMTPMSLVMRLAGRDKLALRRPSAATCWRDLPPPRERSAADYERQF